MKIYFRIFRYAPNIVARLFQFLTFSVFGIIFSVATIPLLIPMLDMMFKYQDNQTVTLPKEPVFSWSLNFVIESFNFHFIRIMQQYGPVKALLFICGAIITSVVLTNLFRY